MKKNIAGFFERIKEDIKTEYDKKKIVVEFIETKSPISIIVRAPERVDVTVSLWEANKKGFFGASISNDFGRAGNSMSFKASQNIEQLLESVAFHTKRFLG